MKRLLSRPILLSTLCLGFCRCGTTEQMVEEQIEILATNEIDSEAWNEAAEELVAVGRPAARQLIGLLRRKIAAIKDIQSALDAAQGEKQLLL